MFLALVAFWQLPALSARALADALGRFFHRAVTVGEVRYHLAPLEAEILDLRVAGPTPGAPPFLHVARARLVPSLRSLWSARTVVLRQLRLERPVVRIHAYPQGGDDIPKMGGGTGGGMGFRIQRLVLADGAFVLDHERVPLDLDLPDFDGRLFNQGGRVLEGRLSFAPGRLQFGSLPPLPVGTELLLTLDGPHLRAREGHLRAHGTDLAYQGELLLRGRPTGTFSLHGRIDLEMLDTHVTRTGFGMKGDGSFDGSLKVEGSRLDIEGRLSGVAGEFDGVPIPTFDTWLTRDARGLRLRDLELAALDGRGRLDLELPPAQRRRTCGPTSRESTPRGCGARSSTGARPAWRRRPRARSTSTGPAAASGSSRAPSPSTSRSARTGARRSRGASSGRPRAATSASSWPTCARPTRARACRGASTRRTAPTCRSRPRASTWPPPTT